MACNYPRTLPEPTIEGNSMYGGPTFIRTEFDVGTRNRRSVDTPMMADFTFILSKRQMQDFLYFYYTTLNRGETKFYAEWEINGFVTPKEFRFSEPFQASNISFGIYKVTAKFEVMTSINDMILGVW